MDRIYAVAFVVISFLNIYRGGWAIGINYGLLGNNLPVPAHTISRLQQLNVSKTRLFSPDHDVLTALHDSGISVIIGTFNEDLESLSSDPSVAASWVETNILPHYSSVDITCLSAGNEVIPGELAQYVPGAIQNLDAALTAAGISDIPVSTAVSMGVLSTSYPPSQGAFSDESFAVMSQIVKLLAAKRSPLLVNAYPYFARVGDPMNVDLRYALFQEGPTVVRDGSLTYTNIFDAMVDAVYSALEEIDGGDDVEVVVTETGWPSGGGRDASVENAETYVNNLIGHVSSGQGTPKRPGREIETYVFAMFNENLKPAGVEQNWGLHYPNLTQVYQANFSSTKVFIQ